MSLSETPLSIVDQIALLSSQGLPVDTIEEKIALGRLLADNGYSRLAPFWRQYQDDPVRGNRAFQPGTTVAQIEDVYTFDSDLRHVLSVGLERFEVALRARLGQEMAMEGMTFLYEGSDLYISLLSTNTSVDARQDLLDSMARELDRSKESFITGYLVHGETPPIWLAMEVLTLGTVSRMYRLIDDPDIRHRIARSFGYPNARFAEATFHSLTVLRNICAHHARLWNRSDIQYAPPVLKRIQIDFDKAVYQRTPWAWITVLADLVDRIDHSSAYSTQLWKLIKTHPQYIDGLQHPHSC